MDQLKSFISAKKIILLITECDCLLKTVGKTKDIFTRFIQDLLDVTKDLRIVLIANNN